MANVVVIGAQWGDEGKGKIVDWLSERADIVVRFQGGHNAGHTLVIGDKTYKLSLLPSGVVRPGKLSVIGNGVVVDPWALIAEIDASAKRGVDIEPATCDRRERHADPAAASRARSAARGGRRRAARSAPPGAASARPTRTRSAAAPSASRTSRTSARSAPRSTACSCTTTRCGAGSASPRSARTR